MAKKAQTVRRISNINIPKEFDSLSIYKAFILISAIILQLIQETVDSGII